MSANGVAVTTTTGGSAVLGAATFQLLGVQVPTFSFVMAVTMSVLVRLWVNRKSAKTHISLADNLLLSSISVILSVGVVVEYQLSFFWACMVSAGIAFSGEAVLVTLSDQILGIIKDSFSILKKKMGISKSDTSETPSDAQDDSKSTDDASDTKEE
jgi:hypothetical protein